MSSFKKELSRTKQSNNDEVDSLINRVFSDTMKSSVSSPAQAFDLFKTIISAYTRVEQITEQEKTKRIDIEHRSKVALEKIELQKTILMNYIEKAFAERKSIFAEHFIIVDDAIQKGNNQQLAIGLKCMNDLATSNPFKNLLSAEEVAGALDNKKHEWEF